MNTCAICTTQATMAAPGGVDSVYNLLQNRPTAPVVLHEATCTPLECLRLRAHADFFVSTAFVRIVGTWVNLREQVSTVPYSTFRFSITIPLRTRSCHSPLRFFLSGVITHSSVRVMSITQFHCFHAKTVFFSPLQRRLFFVVRKVFKRFDRTGAVRVRVFSTNVVKPHEKMSIDSNEYVDICTALLCPESACWYRTGTVLRFSVGAAVPVHHRKSFAN